jgi:hypothetical protein
MTSETLQLPLGNQHQRVAAPASRLRRFFGGPELLLVAVATVVVSVTLPLLRGLAVHENERDAIRTLELFGGEVFAGPRTSLSGLGALMESSPSLNRRLPDTRLFADGQRIFRHGYIFCLDRSEGHEPELLAWPYSHGETGLGAFRLGASGELYGTVNRAARWSGPSRAPSATALAEAGGALNWRRLTGGAR